MFSKEWKLVAVLLATVSCLAACGKSKKKKDKAVPFTGLWINAEADQELTRFATTGNREICDVVMSHPQHFGISASWDGEISLDAWSVSPNGDVYRYTSSAAASTLGNGYRERYYQGRVARSGEYTHKNASLGVALVPPSSRGSCYQAPFARGNANVLVEGPMMTVWHPGTPYQTYVRVSDRQKLNRLNHALSICTELVRVARTCYGYGRVAPVGPQAIAPAPGSLQLPPGPAGRQPRPLGPRVIEQE